MVFSFKIQPLSLFLILSISSTSSPFFAEASLDAVKSFLCKPLLCSKVKCDKRPICNLLDCCEEEAPCTGVDNRTCCDTYDASDWADLSPMVQGFWEDLGWTEEAWCGTDDEPASADAFWDDLTMAEKEAAQNLCYDNDSWNGCPELNCTGEPSNCNDDNYNSLDWADLVNIGVDGEAMILGQDQETWDNGTFVPEVDCLEWAELTPDQQAAAMVFCYDETSWDEEGLVCLDQDNRTCFNDTETLYGNSSWAELPNETKADYEALGYTQEKWDQDMTPESECKFWGELTEEEQAAALDLCYDNDSWNECDD